MYLCHQRLIQDSHLRIQLKEWAETVSEGAFPAALQCIPAKIDTITDFLIKMGIKPRMHLLEISIFSLIHVIIRPTTWSKNL